MPIVYIQNNNPTCNSVKMVFRALGVSADYRNVDEFSMHKQFVTDRFGENAELPVVYNEYGEYICSGLDAVAIKAEFGNS